MAGSEVGEVVVHDRRMVCFHGSKRVDDGVQAGVQAAEEQGVVAEV